MAARPRYHCGGRGSHADLFRRDVGGGAAGRAGNLRVLAVLSKRQSPSMPEVPTIADAGFPGLDGDGWVGALVPAGTPKEIIALLNKQINGIIALPESKEKLSLSSVSTRSAGRPEDFARDMRAEGEKWAKVIKAAGIKAK